VLIFSRSTAITLIITYYLFTLVFLGLAPWIHYSAGSLNWRSEAIHYTTYITVNLSIFAANAIVLLTYFLKFKKHNRQSATTIVGNGPSGFVLLILSCASFTLVFYLNDFSILQLFFRGVIDEIRSTVIESSSASLLLGLTSRLIPVFCFFYAATQLRNSAIIKFSLLFLFLISVFPTSVARYMIAFAYIPLILIFLPPLRSAPVFSAMLIVSLLFVFPFLDQFRYFSGFDNLTLLPTADFFYAAHFDAYENFASAVESNFITFGYQLLGAVFFFIPRALWSTKPVGSGYEMAEQLGYVFNNISMPLLGEGFVNFGFPGVLIFAAIIGIAMSKLDSAFSTEATPNSRIRFSTAVYYFLIGALFFVLRGDLLSSTAYVTAGLFSAFLVKFLCKPAWA
jgi:hypothetical protein